MGTIRNIVLAWVFCLSQHGLAQESTPIAWDVSRKLAWEDFKGKPFKTAWAAATTASGISYEYTGRETKGGYELEFSVGAYFYPEKSWYQPHLCDALVLSHEQLHFDISELFARKLRKQLVAARFTKNAKAEVQEIYNRVLLELNAYQSRYDQETNYSRYPDKQLEWNRKIGDALANSAGLP